LQEGNEEDGMSGELRTEPEPTAPAARRGGWLKRALIGVVLVAVLAGAERLGLGARIGELRAWIGGLGPWGPVAFVVAYALATLLALPASALTVAAGALFGSLLGVVLVSIASTLGATLAFLAARTLLRGLVERWLGVNERFRRLDALVERQGAMVVAITRLVPVFPFNLLNFGFGLTKVRLGTYVFWSWLCMIPGTVLYVVGADAVTRGLAEGRVPWPLVGVLAVAIVGVTLLVRRARRLLAAREQPQDAVNAIGPGLGAGR